MLTALQFNENEWQIILDLLKAEETEIGPEIHHSEHGAYRDELHRRKPLVMGMVKKLESALASPAPR